MLEILFRNEDMVVFKEEADDYTEENELLREFTDKRLHGRRARIIVVPNTISVVRTTKVSLSDLSDRSTISYSSGVGFFTYEQNGTTDVVVTKVNDTVYAFCANTLERLEQLPKCITRSEKKQLEEAIDRFMRIYDKRKIRVLYSYNSTFLTTGHHLVSIGCNNGYRKLKDGGHITKAGCLLVTRDAVIFLAKELSNDISIQAHKIREICAGLEKNP